MKRQTGLLSPAAVRHAKPGMHCDGLGLYLRVTTGESGKISKYWIFRYAVDGRDRQLGLGALDTIAPREAREAAAECRRLRLQGIDPIERRKTTQAAAKAAGANAMTFDQCAARYMKAHASSWRNPKHRQQWTNTLTTYVTPVFGNVLVQVIDVALVTKALEPIWNEKPETASRVRGRVEVILDWATARGHRQGDNPARWRGHLDKLLPAPAKVRKVKHHPALPYVEIGAFMVDLRALHGIAARALEFTILTAARTGEAIGAKWDEIDLQAKVWTVPEDRMKGGCEHRVPLSTSARALLRAMREVRQNDYIFPGDREGKPLSNMAMLEQVRRMNEQRSAVGEPKWIDPRQGKEIVPHGFRSCFRDWSAERTNFPNHVVEMALAHAIGDDVEAAYRRGELFNKRVALMSAWEIACARPARTAKVLPLHATR